MPHIFISYAKKDTRQLAEALNEALNAISDLTAWMDRSLQAGQDWAFQIQDEIDRADYVVVLLSQDVMRRPTKVQRRSFVLNEIDYAQQDNKPILPVLVQPIKMPVQLAGIQYIDLMAAPDDPMPVVDWICQRFDIVFTQSPRKADASADAVRAIIGAPFDWCDVPAGEFLYGTDNQKMILPVFDMAKYPITMSQFKVFVDDPEGYQNHRWWDGLARNMSRVSVSNGSQVPDYPADQIAWYQAMAFCRWLSWKLGGAFDLDKLASWSVRLPTEFEWEKAARGVDGYMYPYGVAFDPDCGNTQEGGAGEITSVLTYPQGESPYGVMDMSGNVFEWTLSNYHAPQVDALAEDLYSDSPRTLRGGAWSYGHLIARSTARFFPGSRHRDISIGFRIMRPLAPHATD